MWTFLIRSVYKLLISFDFIMDKATKRNAKDCAQTRIHLGHYLCLLFLNNNNASFNSINSLCSVLSLEKLGDRLELNIARSLINGSNLTISPHLLRNTLTDEPHPTHELNTKAANPLSNL